MLVPHSKWKQRILALTLSEQDQQSSKIVELQIILNLYKIKSTQFEVYRMSKKRNLFGLEYFKDGKVKLTFLSVCYSVLPIHFYQT